MNHSRFGLWPRLSAAALLALLVAACQTSPPKPVEFTDQESVQATVTAVDVANKKVTLRDSTGEETTIQVPAARNLSQIHAGDTLKVSYVATYRASLAPPGTSQSGAALAAARAPEGEQPGGLVAAGTATTVEIVSVSKGGESVTFRDEYGQLQSMSVETDEGRAFASKLSKGDLVVLEYTEAVAIDVQKPAG